MPRQADRAGANNADPVLNTHETIHTNHSISQAISAASRQVDWWSVYTWSRQFLANAGDFPQAGTPAWGALDNDDPRRLYGVLEAAQHWTVRLDALQQDVPGNVNLDAAAHIADVGEELGLTPELAGRIAAIACRRVAIQQAACDSASRVAALEDWAEVARIIQRRRDFYVDRPWLRRVAS